MNSIFTIIIMTIETNTRWIYRQVILYDLELTPAARARPFIYLRQDARTLIEQLDPVLNNKTLPYYKAVIATYGTHIVTRVSMGVQAVMKTCC